MMGAGGPSSRMGNTSSLFTSLDEEGLWVGGPWSAYPQSSLSSIMHSDYTNV